MLPGEKIPIDGIVVSGKSTIDTAALTGESLPREIQEGDEVISGCINLNGLLKIETTREFSESTATKILELIEEASSRKSKSEAFITKFGRVYTPAVVYAALVLAFIPPIVNFVIGNGNTFAVWVYRALTFLIISCPCALVVSIPLTFFAGIGAASHEGILVKGSNYLEILSKTKVVVFDKTGTLTRGKFDVTDIHPDRISKEELLHLAAHRLPAQRQESRSRRPFPGLDLVGNDRRRFGGVHRRLHLCLAPHLGLVVFPTGHHPRLLHHTPSDCPI